MAPTTFTPEQLWWLAAIVSGGKGDTATAAAIAGAESGGIPSRFLINTDPWRSVDRGLWQINSHWHAEVSDDCAYRALCNARNAYRISNGWRDFTPWATYNNKMYLEHFPPASALPVPIAEPDLSHRWAPWNPGTAYNPLSPAAPFGSPGIIPPAPSTGQDHSEKTHRTGQRAGEHGTMLNQAANAIAGLSRGHSRYPH